MWRLIIEYRTACSDRAGRSGAATARLPCFSGAGFTDGLAAEASRVGDVRLPDPPISAQCSHGLRLPGGPGEFGGE